MQTKIDIIKQVVEEHQYTKVTVKIGQKSKKILLDASTANRLLQIFNKLSDENKLKFERQNWLNLTNIAWSV